MLDDDDDDSIYFFIYFFLSPSSVCGWKYSKNNRVPNMKYMQQSF